MKPCTFFLQKEKKRNKTRRMKLTVLRPFLVQKKIHLPGNTGVHSAKFRKFYLGTGTGTYLLLFTYSFMFGRYRYVYDKTQFSYHKTQVVTVVPAQIFKFSKDDKSNFKGFFIWFNKILKIMSLFLLFLWSHPATPENETLNKIIQEQFHSV